MVSFIKPSAAANMKQYLMPSYGEIMKHALTCKAIGAEVCSSVWCEFVLVKINMNQLGVILYLNMYVCKFKPIQHVFRQKAFCKESILFHSYTLFYSLQRGQGIFIAINYTHVFSGDPKGCSIEILPKLCFGFDMVFANSTFGDGIALPQDASGAMEDERLWYGVPWVT